ncbi:hypothetical protein CAPN004_22690 [Capnocytophaga cynodegmi]|uniref:hypothetical protein n=1 Tax=Capnocytophaga TaxID=1016 RepID=UPI001AD2D00F|nr:hypothetical protein [Capnocytophaga cynodegmi]GIM53239.1 hypothetical protein CAPN004_22690 [Capnocytophaga cynodegmi]
MKLLVLLGVVSVAAYIILRKKSDGKFRTDNVDKLTLSYVKKFFSEEKVDEAGCVPVLLKVNKDNPYNIEVIADTQSYILSYYNEKTGEILKEKTLIVNTRELDSNLIDSFGDKELIVFKEL